MNIDDLRKQIPDEASCRKFFEKLIWPDGRLCPADGAIRTSLKALAAVPAFMNALDVSSNSLSPQELQCTVQNCLYGNGFWQFITYSTRAKASHLFF